MIPLSLPRRQPAPPLVARRADGSAVSLREYAWRDDLFLVLLHGPGCPDCAQIAAELGRRRRDWEDWGVALLVLHSEPEPFPCALFRQAHDPEGETRRRYAPEGADVVLAVVDVLGRLMEGWRLRHPEPVDWREVAETVRWVAIQEPECGACTVLEGWE